MQVNLSTPCATFVKLSRQENQELFNYVMFTKGDVYTELPDGCLVLKSFKDANQFLQKADEYTLYVLTWLDERVAKLDKGDIRTHTPMLIRETAGALRCDLITDFTGGMLVGRFGAYSLTQVEAILSLDTETKINIDKMFMSGKQAGSTPPVPWECEEVPAPAPTPEPTTPKPLAPQAPMTVAEVFRMQASRGKPVQIARMERLSEASTAGGGIAFVNEHKTRTYALQSLNLVSEVRLGESYLVKVTPRSILDNGAIHLGRCFEDAGCDYKLGLLSMKDFRFYQYSMTQGKLNQVTYSEHKHTNSAKLHNTYTKDLTDDHLFYARVTFVR